MNNPYESARRAVQWGFFFMGVPIGVLVPRLAEIKAGIDASDSIYGTAIAMSGIGAILGNAIGARLVHRYGSKPIARIGISLILAGNVANALAPTAWWLAFVALCNGFSYSVQNVGINSQGALVEQGLGRSFMPRAHAFWSIGTMSAAFVSSLLAPHISPLTALSLGAGISLIGFYALTNGLLPTHLDDRPHNDASQLQQHERIPRGVIKFLIVIAIGNSLALLAEISAGDWSSVLLREDFGVAIGPNGYAFTAFMVMQMLGRFFSPAVVDRYSLASVVRTTGLIGASGFVIFLFFATRASETSSTRALVLSCIAYAFLGLGISVMAPAWVTATGSIPGLPSARAIALVGMMVALGSLVGRVTLANVSGAIPLPITLGSMGIALAIAASLTHVLVPERAQRHAITKGNS